MRINSEEAKRLAMLAVWVFFCLVPFYWVGTLSFQPEISFPPSWFPTDPTLTHYVDLLSRTGIQTAIINSLTVSVVGAIVGVMVGSLAGYSFSRMDFKWKSIAFLAVMLAFQLPPYLNIVPLYSLFGKVGLLDSRIGMIILYQISILPLNIFLFMNYFSTIEDSIVESATLDGCNHFERFYKIIMPLSKPALIAGFIFGFRFLWSEYVFATTFIRSKSKMLFTAALYRAVYAGQYTVNYRFMAAGSLILVIPTLIILIGGQKYLRTGLQLGGVSG